MRPFNMESAHDDEEIDNPLGAHDRDYDIEE